MHTTEYCILNTALHILYSKRLYYTLKGLLTTVSLKEILCGKWTSFRQQMHRADLPWVPPRPTPPPLDRTVYEYVTYCQCMSHTVSVDPAGGVHRDVRERWLSVAGGGAGLRSGGHRNCAEARMVNLTVSKQRHSYSDSSLLLPAAGYLIFNKYDLECKWTGRIYLNCCDEIRL